MSAIALLIASLLSQNATSEKPTCHKDCRTSETGLQFVSHFEGYVPFVYKDQAGLDTIGIGHLILPGEKFKEPMLPDEAHALLKKDIRIAEKGVNRLVQVQIRQNQADAVISFTYNVGSGALGKSTLLKRINAERHSDVPPQFLRWNKAFDPKTKKMEISEGLQVRRESEADFYKGK